MILPPVAIAARNDHSQCYRARNEMLNECVATGVILSGAALRRNRRIFPITKKLIRRRFFDFVACGNCAQNDTVGTVEDAGPYISFISSVSLRATEGGVAISMYCAHHILNP